MNMSFPEAGEVVAAVSCLTADFASCPPDAMLVASNIANSQLSRNLMPPPLAPVDISKVAFPQNVNLTENCSCRGLSAVRGEPKFEFGVAGMNSAVPIGVGASDPPGTAIPPFGQVTDPPC